MSDTTLSDSAVPLPEGVADGEGALDEFGEKLAAFNAFRKSDEGAADAVLQSIGANGKAEIEIIQQMAVPRALYRTPEEFDQAHRKVMQAMEVLQRNGARNLRLPKIGPLSPIAGYATQQLTRFIVRSHIRTLIENLRHLYGRREAWTRPGSRERRSLQRARLEAERLAPGYKSGKALGLPTFLLGGAFISTLLRLAASAGTTVRENPVLIVGATVLLLLLLLGAAWCALRAAAAARHRIKLTVDQPMKTLYGIVGAAGNPPKDQSVQFALYAIVGMVVAWLVIPAGLFLLFTR